MKLVICAIIENLDQIWGWRERKSGRSKVPNSLFEGCYIFCYTNLLGIVQAWPCTQDLEDAKYELTQHPRWIHPKTEPPQYVTASTSGNTIKYL